MCTGIWVNNNILSSTKFNSFLDNECSKLQVDQIVKRSPNSPVVLCENTNNEREEAYSHCMNFIQLQIKLYNITSHASYLLLCLLHCSDTSIKRVVLISRTYYRLICSYLLPFFSLNVLKCSLTLALLLIALDTHMTKQLRIVISHANIFMRNQVYLHSKAAYINVRKPGMIEDSFVYHYSA